MSLRGVSIIILSYNNLDYTKDCINSIKAHTDMTSTEIIVVDNNSTDGSAEWLQTNSNGIKLLLNGVNEGFPRGCNQGIALSNPDNDILLLNNDTLVTHNWLANLQTCLYSAPDIGAAGAVSKSNDNLQGSALKYSTHRQMHELAAANNISDPARWEQKIFLIGFCLLIKREVFDLVGGLDEAYSPGYVEDNDYSLRIVKQGYRLMLCHDCFIHHYHGTEFRKDLNKFMPMLLKNRKTFLDRWGFEIFAFDKVRFACLHIFDPPAGTTLKVLELNCGIGVNLLKIRYAAPQARLYGIEPNIAMANIAKHVAKVTARPLETALSELPKGHFDYIFAGDALSKSAQPRRLLLLIKRALKPSGKVIGEAPNAMYYIRLREVLSGTAYNPNADGHINRFTAQDIVRLLGAAGLSDPYIFYWYATPTPDDNAFIDALTLPPFSAPRHLLTAYSISYRGRS